MDNGLLGSITEWYAQPFNTQGNAFKWVLFVGLLLVAVLFWQFILLEILREK